MYKYYSHTHTGLIIRGDLQLVVILAEEVCDFSTVQIRHVCNL